MYGWQLYMQPEVLVDLSGVSVMVFNIPFLVFVEQGTQLTEVEKQVSEHEKHDGEIGFDGPRE
jgi:hypothetical protein